MRVVVNPRAGSRVSRVPDGAARADGGDRGPQSRDALDRVLAIAPRFGKQARTEVVAAAICDEARTTFGCDVALLLSVTDHDVIVEWREPTSTLVPPGRSFPVDELPVLRDALRESKLAFEPDMRRRLRGRAAELVQQLGLRSAIRVPISIHGEGHRALVLQWEQPIPEPDGEALLTLRRFVDHAGLALEHAARLRLEQEARRRADETRRLLDVTAALAATQTVDDVAAALAAESRTRGAADAVAVYVVASGELTVAAHEGLEPADLATLQPVNAGGASPIQDAIRRNELVLIESPEMLGARYPARGSASSRFAASASIPLPASAGVVGGVDLLYADRRAFRTADRDFLAAFASQAGVALERAVALERERATRARSERLHALTAALSGALGPDEVADVCVLQGSAFVGADSAVLATPTSSGPRVVAGIGEEQVPLGRWVTERMASSSASQLPLVLPSRDALRRDAAVDAYLDGTGAIVVAPLVAAEEMLAILAFAWSSERRFDADDETFLETLASQCAQAYDRALRYEAERAAATTLQRSLLPPRLPHVPGLELAARYLPGQKRTQVGGDWYDVFELRNGRIGLVVGDVVGNGIPAAAAMGQLRNALRAFASEGLTPATTLSRLNALTESMATFATVTFTAIDPHTRACRYARAGHPPALVLRPDGTVVQLDDANGPPIGALAGDVEYTQATLTLEPGSTLLLYTDGLIETPGALLRERLALLAETVAGLTGTGPDELAHHVIERMSVASSRRDDVAVLAVRLAPVANEHEQR